MTLWAALCHCLKGARKSRCGCAERGVSTWALHLGHREMQGILSTVRWFLPWIALVVSRLHADLIALPPVFSLLLSWLLSSSSTEIKSRPLHKVSMSSQEPHNQLCLAVLQTATQLLFKRSHRVKEGLCVPESGDEAGSTQAFRPCGDCGTLWLVGTSFLPHHPVFQCTL